MRRLSSLLWLHLGHWLGGHGLASLAETCYRNSAGGHDQRSVQAWCHLGKSLLDRGQAKDAVATYEQAIQCDPRHARAWCGLGAAHRLMADLDAARRAYDEALRIDPDLPQALTNLGEWFLVKRDAAVALTYFDRSLAREPRQREALANRVAALFELGRYPEAETAALKAIDCFPDQAAMHVNHGNVLLHTGQARSAVKAFRKALECDPACAEAHMNLATFFGESHHLAQTIGFIEQEIALKGETTQRLGALALAQAAKKDYAAAEKTCRKALDRQAGCLSALITLGSCLSARGDHQGAIALNEQALKANPQMPSIFSCIAFSATYLLDLSPQAVFEHHRRWSQCFETPTTERRYVHKTGGDPDRLLRIGYVSGDFGRHPVGSLLRDVVRYHDLSQFEIHAFSMMRQDDDITIAIRKCVSTWHDVLLTSDDELVRLIHDQGIDILVDLSGHTAYGRLPVFVLKPAPVQATWIGYFHSTGLEAIDYFITDPHTSPADVPQWFSEIPVWLPHSRFCYSPPDYAPEVTPLPLLTHGQITFGSFNRLEKLIDPVIEAWARILKAVPNSRLFMKAGALEDESIRDDLSRRFAAHGLSAERLELRGPSPHPEMMAEYGEMDIALDTFPFNGGMTTLEALWMGVPVVTLVGQSVVARQTFSVLANLGLAETLAFSDVDAFVQGAIDLANDPERLATLRRELRPRLSASPLRQAETFTRDLEALYRQMWRAWCAGEKLGVGAPLSVLPDAPPVTMIPPQDPAPALARLRL
ncbi:MAG: tetratricopeptide repeat protein [Pseudomonadota bacterium]